VTGWWLPCCFNGAPLCSAPAGIFRRTGQFRLGWNQSGGRGSLGLDVCGRLARPAAQRRCNSFGYGDSAPGRCRGCLRRRSAGRRRGRRPSRPLPRPPGLNATKRHRRLAVVDVALQGLRGPRSLSSLLISPVPVVGRVPVHRLSVCWLMAMALVS